jgi:hypothetical protein
MQKQGPNYSEYDRLLRAYLDEQGRVDYAGLKKEIGALKTFVYQLGAIDPLSIEDADERLRYYLTSYNAWVLYFTVNAYPAKNEMWNLLGLFRDHEIRIGGRKSSLETLEHKIIRPQFKDPRAHFYLNCGAASCPVLRPGAEAGVSAILDESAKRFINDPRHVQYDAAEKRLTISKIFDWFADDFLTYLKIKRGIAHPHIAQYLLLYLDGPAREMLSQTPLDEVRVKYFGYDRALSEQP